MLIVIPARLSSRRLPDKPLQLIDGEPLICHLVRQIQNDGFDAEVIVATDSARIEDAVGAMAPVVLTKSTHRNGTERVAEVVARIGMSEDVVVNVQGDQLYVPRMAISGAVARVLRGADDVGTVVMPLSPHAIADPNHVKVIMNGSQCRAFARLFAWSLHFGWSEQLTIAEHVGVYAYAPAALQRWVGLPRSALEETIGLEQTRPLEAGMTIGAAWLTGARPLAIDTPEALQRARTRVSERPARGH